MEWMLASAHSGTLHLIKDDRALSLYPLPARHPDKAVNQPRQALEP